MKHIFTWIALLALLIFSTPVKSQDGTGSNMRIGILGMFHLGNTNDMASVKLQDLSSQKRQEELEEMVIKLKKYNPTKILVEYPYAKDSILQEKYQNFISGNAELGKSETEQIGFRLAKELGHDKLYAIDHRMEMPMNEIVAYCQENNKMSEFQNLVSQISEFASSETKKLESQTLPDFIAEMNSQNFDYFISNLYVNDMLAFGEAGINYSLSWYKRNLHIFHNIIDVIEPEKDERILVIIGSAHRSGLREFVEAHKDMEFLEVAGYLK